MHIYGANGVRQMIHPSPRWQVGGQDWYEAVLPPLQGGKQLYDRITDRASCQEKSN
jgi:hypothetical protein